jgi:hypothetical protein
VSGKQAEKPAKQVVFLVGASHNAKDGQKRLVSPEVAKSLVDRGLARYPANYEADR